MEALSRGRTQPAWRVVIATLGLLPTLAALAAAEDAETRWHEVVSSEGRFRVELPEAPRVETLEQSTLLGAVRSTKYTLGFAEDRSVAVEVHDIPRLAPRLFPTALILDRTRAGVISDMDAEPVTTRETTLAGLPARDFTYRVPGDPPLLERAIVVLVDSRLYIVTGMAPEAPQADPTLTRFFASFRFWGEGEAPPEAVLEPAP